MSDTVQLLIVFSSLGGYLFMAFFTWILASRMSLSKGKEMDSAVLAGLFWPIFFIIFLAVLLANWVANKFKL